MLFHKNYGKRVVLGIPVAITAVLIFYQPYIYGTSFLPDMFSVSKPIACALALVYYLDVFMLIWSYVKCIVTNAGFVPTHILNDAPASTSYEPNQIRQEMQLVEMHHTPRDDRSAIGTQPDHPEELEEDEENQTNGNQPHSSLKASAVGEKELREKLF